VASPPSCPSSHTPVQGKEKKRGGKKEEREKGKAACFLSASTLSVSIVVRRRRSSFQQLVRCRTLEREEEERGEGREKESVVSTPFCSILSIRSSKENLLHPPFQHQQVVVEGEKRGKGRGGKERKGERGEKIGG